eukprot:TRINITY_DN85319_c0_g1_i1.p1 TRINITY_DN85319_c0_g1~~TRINITY_DN85319_c0_g1_i1.p1  ORF type:complete len:243 (+),score=32.01 TRINITY_DN85319_c0_g1_i1:60-788(+)
MLCCCSDAKEEFLIEVPNPVSPIPESRERGASAVRKDQFPDFVQASGTGADTQGLPPEGFQNDADSLLLGELEGTYWMSKDESTPVGHIRGRNFCFVPHFGLKNSPISLQGSKLSLSAASKDSALPTLLHLNLKIVDARVEEIVWTDGDIWIRDVLAQLWNSTWQQKSTGETVGDIKHGCIEWAKGFQFRESPIYFEGPGRISMKVQVEGSPKVDTYFGELNFTGESIKEIRWSDGDVWLRL